jgi:hypothetical protein
MGSFTAMAVAPSDFDTFRAPISFSRLVLG